MFGRWRKTETPCSPTSRLWRRRFWIASTPRNASAFTRCSGSGLGSGPTVLWRLPEPSRNRSEWEQMFVLRTDHVYQLEAHALEREAEAEDDVVRARDPDGSVGLEDAPRLLQPPDVELVIRFEAHGPV